MKRIYAIGLCGLFLALLASPPGVAAQEMNGWEGQSALPRHFREIWLGMGLDDLRDALLRDALFNFRGDRDVSFVPTRSESLIETAGSSFVQRAFFQLRDGALFIMSLTLNTGLMDHHSMFTRFVERYGEPTSLNPCEAVWDDGNTRIALERPLTVRYIDLAVFDDIVSESMLIQSQRVHEFQDFLNEF